MAFDRLAFEKVWTSSEDFPTYEDSEVRVRQDMQYHPDAIKDFVNAHLTALEAESAAGNIGVAGGTLQDLLNAYLARFERVDDDIEELATGGVPTVNQCVRVAFAAADWTAVSGGVQFVIPQTVHKRTRNAYGYNIWEAVTGGALSSTWNTAATQVVRDDVSGNMTLSAPAAYAGAIAFFGL